MKSIVALNSVADASVVLDTDGTMYGLHGKSRLISKAIAMSLLLLQSPAGKENAELYTYRRNTGLTQIDTLSPKSLHGLVNEIRMSFTDSLPAHVLLEYLKSMRSRVLIYLSVKGTDKAILKEEVSR